MPSQPEDEEEDDCEGDDDQKCAKADALSAARRFSALRLEPFFSNGGSQYLKLEHVICVTNFSATGSPSEDALTEPCFSFSSTR